MTSKTIDLTLEEIKSFRDYHDLLLKKEKDISDYKSNFEQLVKKLGFYRFLKYSDTNNLKEIIICGYYKIMMKKDSPLFQCYKRNIITFRWIKYNPTRGKSNIFNDRFFNFLRTDRSIIEYDYYLLISKLVLSDIKNAYVKMHDYSILIAKATDKYKNILNFDKNVNFNLIQQYLYYVDKNKMSDNDYPFVNVLTEKTKGILKKASLDAKRSRALYLQYFKYIWKMIDRDIYAVMARMFSMSSMDIATYNYVASNIDNLKRVNKESYNLLPLLAYTDNNDFTNLALFSYDNWTNQNTRTINTGLKIMNKSSFRWLKKQKLMVVKNYCYINNPQLLELIPKDQTFKIPVFVYVFLFRMLGDFLRHHKLKIEIAEPMLKIFIKCWLQYIGHLYHDEKFKQLKERFHWLVNEFKNTFDYFKYLEIGNIPAIDKNASWQSIVKQSADWHISIINKKLANKKLREWGELYKQTIIDNIEITPLNSTKKLYDEATLMHHCVSDYEPYCINGNYRVFHLELLESRDITKMATLGLILSRGKWNLEQLQAYNNELPLNILQDVANKFIKKVNRTHHQSL